MRTIASATLYHATRVLAGYPHDTVSSSPPAGVVARSRRARTKQRLEAAACQFEARMVPMASQDAVLDAASFQRETHVRTAIVEREDLAALVPQMPNFDSKSARRG